MSLFGLADYYIVPTGEADLLVTLPEGLDPERAIFVNYYDGTISSIVPNMTETGYAFRTKLDSVQTTGYAYTNLHMYPAQDCSIMDVRTVVCFASEADADAFVAQMPQYGYNLQGWAYVDDGQEEAAAPADLPALGGQVQYELTIIDQQGEAIPGVTVTICDEHTCKILTSDEEGVIAFEAEPYAWEVKVVAVPAGCAYDDGKVWTLETTGGSLIIDLFRLMDE